MKSLIWFSQHISTVEEEALMCKNMWHYVQSLSCFSNDFNVIFSFIALSFSLLLAVLWTGEVWEFLSFTERYPSIIYNILLFGVTSALGQVSGWKNELDGQWICMRGWIMLWYIIDKSCRRTAYRRWQSWQCIFKFFSYIRPSSSWRWCTLGHWPAPSSPPRGSSSPSSALLFCLATSWRWCNGLAPSWFSSVRVIFGLTLCCPLWIYHQCLHFSHSAFPSFF